MARDLLAFIGGGIAGMITGIIHTKGKINAPLIWSFDDDCAALLLTCEFKGKANIGLMQKETRIYPYIAWNDIVDCNGRICGYPVRRRHDCRRAGIRNYRGGDIRSPYLRLLSY